LSIVFLVAAVGVTPSWLPGVAAAQPAPATRPVLTPSQSPSPPSSTEREEAIASRVKAQLSPEIERAIRAAQEGQQTANQQLGNIVNLMEVFLALIGLVAAILTTVGIIEWRRLVRLRKDAEKHIATMAGEARRIEENSMKVTELRLATERAWNDIDLKFEDLPDLKVSRISGGSPMALPPEVSVVFEDADILLVVGRQLKVMKDEKRMSVYFYKLAGYWRYVSNYPRAIARAENAVRLDANSGDAFRQLALVLSNFAAESPMGSVQKSDMLHRAESALQKAVQLRGRHDSGTLNDLAWIYDEREEYQTAATHYKRARELDNSECATKPRDPNWDITYNLACTLAKDGKYEESLAELAKVIDKEENWQWVLEDRDFQAMLAHETWGPRLRALAEQGRSRATSFASSSYGSDTGTSNPPSAT
jgi:tetratricopeptide (TPR) repeat protein